MRPDTLLVVDAMNYIKGFRYQLYCAAREAKLRVCTVSPSLSPHFEARPKGAHAACEQSRSSSSRRRSCAVSGTRRAMTGARTRRTCESLLSSLPLVYPTEPALGNAG